MGLELLTQLAGRRGGGIVSVCSAHPLAIEAALRQALEDGGTALIEATCNQVNQEGGYTGMDPSAFRQVVEEAADRTRLPRDRLLLGGDHLGPNPWRHLPADEAMARAGDMVESYARAGFGKLHLDASMGCAGEPDVLADALVASRAAALASRAEAVAPGRAVYVIGTEVPTPGGAAHALDAVEPTQAQAVRLTWSVHRDAFAAMPAVWDRVVAIVVQPGVEFGHEAVAAYRPERSRALVDALASLPGLVGEAHSTDYQSEEALRQLVADGFRILKVGPALTFAMREALYGLDAIRRTLRPDAPSLPAVMEQLMLDAPEHWSRHYPGNEDERRVLRHFSYSDRIRYLWPEREAVEAVEALLAELDGWVIPDTVLSQCLPRLLDRVRSGAVERTGRAMVIEAVRDVLRPYWRAVSSDLAAVERVEALLS